MTNLVVYRGIGAAPLLEGLGADINYSALSKINSTLATVAGPVETTAQLNSHPYIAHHGGLFWAMFSTSPVNEDQNGQRVRYATSEDGQTWSSVGYITPAPVDGFRYIARGFWKRGDDFLALASLDEAGGGYFGESLSLRAFAFADGAWSDIGPVADDTINNFPPEILPNGQWLFGKRDHTAVVSFMKGDLGDWADIALPDAVPAATLNEPTWYRLPSGPIVALFRDTAGSKFLYRALSFDNGATWTAPTRTNFPDASSKNCPLVLSDGRVCVLSNSSRTTRNPLTIAVSDDGEVFDRMVVLRDEATSAQYPGAGKLSGYQYCHMMEYEGILYCIYTRNKEDIQVSIVDIDDLP